MSAVTVPLPQPSLLESVGLLIVAFKALTSDKSLVEPHFFLCLLGCPFVGLIDKHEMVHAIPFQRITPRVQVATLRLGRPRLW